MSDIKVVLYKENRTPRSLALSTRMIYRILFSAVLVGLALVLSLGMAVKFYMQSRARITQTALPTTSSTDEELGPSNSLEQLNKSLKDQLDQLNNKIANATATAAAPKDIDKKNPALALFTPIVSDHTQDEPHVLIQNFHYSKANGKTPASLTFELHNAHPGESTEKGYLVVLARTDKGLLAYPNVFDKTGAQLLDFERGETFQVARFRLVNATFDSDAQFFQILIFTRKGEIWINTMYEAK